MDKISSKAALNHAKNVEQISTFFARKNVTVQSMAQKNRQTIQKFTQLSLDSRQIEEGDVFIAIQGENCHGLEYLESVLQKCPGLVVSDRPLNSNELLLLQKNPVQTIILIVKDLKTYLGELSAWFYDQPSTQLKVVGITGTNGKTSTAFYTAQLLEALGQKVALIGTLGNGPLSALQTTANTTPDSIQVHKLLHQFLAQGIDWVVMEVSSHALSLGRIQGVEFQTVALTQVTRDHIDFHGTVEAYQEAKAKLFVEYPTRNRVLNIEDKLGQILFDALHDNFHQAKIWRYQPQVTQNAVKQAELNHSNKTINNADLSCADVQLMPHGMAFSVQVNGVQKSPVQLALMGQFNIENTLCALSILMVNDYSWQQIQPHISRLMSVAGRMQVLAKSPSIILDFAHTPDALEQVLKAVKAHLKTQANDTNGKLKVVFGCGGNRDQGKRSLMGAIAENLADAIMITSDNPRNEDPQLIIDEIMSGLVTPEKAEFEIDRQKAILSVLKRANSADVIVIAGKGHESYQEISGIKHPFSDVQVVNSWLSNGGKPDVL